MKKICVSFFMTLFSFTIAVPAAVTLSNISVQQRQGTKEVEIIYDLDSTPATFAHIAITINSSAGLIDAEHLSGDLGWPVETGTGRVIIWDAGADWDAQQEDSLTFTLTANINEHTLVPVGTNSGVDPDFGSYSLTLSQDLWMGRFEVTKKLWDHVAEWGRLNGYTDLPEGGGKAPNHPVHSVNWYDVVKWCNARSEMEGRTPVYTVGGFVYKTGTHQSVEMDSSASGYRLPTVDEREYAARGGLVGKRYPWGDDASFQKANVKISNQFNPTTGEPLPRTLPVGSFSPNGYGLYDMAGNVWEWCWDEGSYRAIRGGSWNFDTLNARCAANHWFPPPENVANEYGFRTVVAAASIASDDIISTDAPVDTRDLWEYEIVEGGVVITGYTGPNAVVFVPEEIDGLPVTAIERLTMFVNASVTHVVVPASVQTLGILAFAECPNLEAVYFLGTPPAEESKLNLLYKNSPNAVNYYYPEAKDAWETHPEVAEYGTYGNRIVVYLPYFYTIHRREVVIDLYVGEEMQPPFALPLAQQENIEIPRLINGLPVVGIGDEAFMDSFNMGSVGIPDTVQWIGNWAFRGCTNLVAVVLPDSVEWIGDWSFADCWSLVYVTLSDTLTHIGDYAFYECYALEYVSIPASVEWVGFRAFGDCPKLKGLCFHGDAPAHGGDLFFKYPNAGIVRYITGTAGWNADYSGWTTVGVAALDEVEFQVASRFGSPWPPVGHYRFSCPGQKQLDPRVDSFVIDQGIRWVSDGWTGTGSVPASGSGNQAGPITLIEDSSIAWEWKTSFEIKNVSAVQNPGQSNVEITYDIISDVGDGVPIGVYITYQGEQVGTQSLSGDIGLGVSPGRGKRIIWEAGADWNGNEGELIVRVYHLTEPEFYGSDNVWVDVRGAGLFNYRVESDGSLTIMEYLGSGSSSLTIPSEMNGMTVGAIDNLVNASQNDLRYITVPETVERLGRRAFSHFPNLKGVFYLGTPPQLDVIRTLLFDQSLGAVNYYYPEAKDAWEALWDEEEEHLFGGKSAGYLPFEYVVKNQKVTITQYLGDEEVTHVVIPSVINGYSVVQIGKLAFFGAEGLVEVTVPATVRSIGDFAFSFCVDLEKVIFKGDAPSIGEGIFLGSDQVVVYYDSATAGWGAVFGGRPAQPQPAGSPVQFSLTNVQMNGQGFEFDVEGEEGATFVVEAASSLSSGV